MKAPLLTALGLWLPLSAAWAQSFAVTGLNPARNAVAAPRADGLSITFSDGLGAAGSIAVRSALRVFSSQRGGRLTGPALGGNPFIFYTQPFRPGETLRATLTTAAQSIDGTALAAPLVWQFTAAVQGGTGQFGGGAAVAVGWVPYTVTTADVDNDGDLDLLTASEGSNAVNVRRNDGLGHFSGGPDVPVVDSPFWLTTADLDADNDLDLLTVNSLQGTVTVRFNDGQGSFSGGTTFSTGGPAYGLATGDVDGDGDLDIALARPLGAGGEVGIWLNDGRGTFSAAGAVGTSTSGRASDIVLADLDNDWDLDLAAANSDNGGTLAVRLNNGQGSFSGTLNMSLSNVLTSLAAADIDADGDLDLLAGDDANRVWVRRNNGNATFAAGPTVTVGQGVRAVVTGDLDGDGDLDLLTSNMRDNSFSVRLNNGQGIFGGGTDTPVGQEPLGAALADVDGDGDLDALVANAGGTTVSVRLNDGTGAPLATATARAATLSCYPNPAHELLQVNAPAGTRLVRLCTMLGQQVRAVAVVPGTETRVPLSGLPAGVYLLQAGPATTRVVVE